jgi:hypothetical protein
MRENILCFIDATPEEIDLRLADLESEWDTERILEANAASFSLLGLLLGRTVSGKFYILPAAVTAFLLQHAIQGWCPPLPMLRRLGVRTAEEIDAERYALKLIRGDFRLSGASGSGRLDIDEIMEAVDEELFFGDGKRGKNRVFEAENERQREIAEPLTPPESPTPLEAKSRDEQPGVFGGHV